MKITQKVILLVFLFLFPLISYLYLKSGYNVRKHALDELEAHTSISPTQLDILESVLADSLDSVLEGVFVLHQANGQEDKIELMAERLQNRPEFSAVIFYPDNVAIKNNPSTENLSNLYEVGLSTAQMKQIFSAEENILGKERKIRISLPSTFDGLKKLYEYTIILLPLEKREKVELKRKKSY